MELKSKPKRAPTTGTVVIWPSGVRERYGISGATLWRWEKIGRLPARDVNLGGKTGWRPATLTAAESCAAGISISNRLRQEPKEASELGSVA